MNLSNHHSYEIQLPCGLFSSNNLVTFVDGGKSPALGVWRGGSLILGGFQCAQEFRKHSVCPQPSQIA